MPLYFITLPQAGYKVKQKWGFMWLRVSGTSFYMGDLSEVNLWDRAIPEVSVKQLAASRTKWKFPGNVVSWNQLVEESAGTVQISTPSEDPGMGWACIAFPCRYPVGLPTCALCKIFAKY